MMARTMQAKPPGFLYTFAALVPILPLVWITEETSNGRIDSSKNSVKTEMLATGRIRLSDGEIRHCFITRIGVPWFGPSKGLRMDA
jgi:hypothetical protein